MGLVNIIGNTISNYRESIIYDSDASVFLSATAIDNIVIKESLNKLVVGLKTYLLWNKIKALWPFAGYTYYSHKFNLKDPRDLDAAFRLVDTGSVNHNLNGITTATNASFSDTFFDPSAQLSAATNVSLFVFTPTNAANATYYDMGVQIGSLSCLMNTDSGSNLILSAIGGTSSIYGNTGGGSSGFSVVRKNGTGVAGASTFKNGADKRDQNYPGGTTLPSGNMYLGNSNIDGSPATYNHRAISLAGIADALTDQEIVDLSTLVAVYRASLSGLPVDQPLPEEYFEMTVPQGAVLNQFRLYYKLTAGADIWLDWGYGVPVKLIADGTERFTDMSVYPTPNTTYSMRLYGDGSKILTVKFTATSVAQIIGSELPKLTNLEVLYHYSSQTSEIYISQLASTLKELYWNGKITGDIGALPSGLTYLYLLQNGDNLFGSTNNLPAELVTLTLNGSTKIYGTSIPTMVTYAHLNGLRNTNTGAGNNLALNIDDFNPAMTYCYLNDVGAGITGDGYITGNFANFPRALEMLWMDNVGQLITGDSDDLPPGLTTFACMDMTTSDIYIRLNTLPATIENFELKWTPAGRVSGALDSAPFRNVIRRFKIVGVGDGLTGNIESYTSVALYEFIVTTSGTAITYGGGATPAWAAMITLSIQTSMSGATVDSLIDAIATSQTGTVTGTYSFSGARTSASDADVADLLSNHNKTVITAN